MPKWTDRIHEEWLEHVLQNRPDLNRAQLERTRRLMELHAEGSRVEGYEPLVADLELPDENDRHVLAAAITAEATVIVTLNLSDFPAEVLEAYDLEACHPDEFVCQLLDQAPDRVLRVLRAMRTALKRPPQTWEQQLETFRACGMRRMVRRLAGRADALEGNASSG